MRKDTIAAISTAMTNSGIGIVRISGEEAFDIIKKIYKGKKDKDLSKVKSHTIHYGYIMDGEETIDEVLVMIMRGPHSYTGEDTVEINCHGGVFVVKKILETVIKYGARPADPGEFTKRAFLNGRLDLSQAEAVIDVIYNPINSKLIRVAKEKNKHSNENNGNIHVITNDCFFINRNYCLCIIINKRHLCVFLFHCKCHYSNYC